MAAYDIIPDIHGHRALLASLLTRLGYRKTRRVWRHSDSGRSALFLGDFIDRGAEQGTVLDLVRRMVDSGNARAVIGNHEFNALCYHTRRPETGAPLRPHTATYTRQHQAFLDEFPPGAPQTAEWIAWMAGLPLGIELPELRIVHACWHDAHLRTALSRMGRSGFTPGFLIAASRRGSDLHAAVETLLKGPEVRLPDGVSFTDKDGHRRTTSRIAWWSERPGSWAEAVASWPEDQPPPPGTLDAAAAAGIGDFFYPTQARPVFFGHYWLNGPPELQAPNALCLDYSVAKGGPLVSYCFDTADHDPRRGLDLARITTSAPLSPAAPGV